MGAGWFLQTVSIKSNYMNFTKKHVQGIVLWVACICRIVFFYFLTCRSKSRNTSRSLKFCTGLVKWKHRWRKRWRTEWRATEEGKSSLVHFKRYRLVLLTIVWICDDQVNCMCSSDELIWWNGIFFFLYFSISLQGSYWSYCMLVLSSFQTHFQVVISYYSQTQKVDCGGVGFWRWKEKKEEKT